LKKTCKIIDFRVEVAKIYLRKKEIRRIYGG